MAHKNHTTDLTQLLLKCAAQPDPMLSMPEGLCSQLMEAEVDHSWVPRKVSVQTEEAAAAADIVPVVWIPEWE